MTASLAWYEDEARFATQLARGRRTELGIALRLLPLGLWVRTGALQPRNGLANTDPDLADQGDVYVEGGHLLEVKGRGLEFTCADDYPFPTVFLGSSQRRDRRGEQPCAFVIVSEPTGVAVVVPSSTSDRWFTETKRDSHRGFDECSVAAPRDCIVSWERLVRHLQNPCALERPIDFEWEIA